MTLIPRHYVRRSTRLALAFIATLLLVAGRGSGHLGLLQAEDNPILAENQRPGDIDWNISGIGDPSIQGFATNMSVNHGAPVQFKVDVSPAGPFHLDIYRIGYYNGAGARRVVSIENQAGVKQPGCTSDAATGLVDCGNWTVSAQWNVPADAVSGVYIAKVVREATHTLPVNGGDLTEGSHMVFVVRDDARQADVSCRPPTRRGRPTTDTAAPACTARRPGSASATPGRPTVGPCPNRATKVELQPAVRHARDQRPQLPVQRRIPDGALARGERLRRQVLGRRRHRSARRRPDVGSRSRSRRCSSRSGHDEYWSGDSARQRRERARRGVNLAFFSGNEMYWKTRYEPSIDGSNTPTGRWSATRKRSRARRSIRPSTATGNSDLDRHLARPALQPARRRRPPGERRRPARSGRSTPAPRAITVPASMAGMRFWQQHARRRLCTSGVATLSAESLGYEWDEDLDNGARPGRPRAPLVDDGRRAWKRSSTTARRSASARRRTT